MKLHGINNFCTSNLTNYLQREDSFEINKCPNYKTKINSIKRNYSQCYIKPTYSQIYQLNKLINNNSSINKTQDSEDIRNIVTKKTNDYLNKKENNKSFNNNYGFEYNHLKQKAKINSSKKSSNKSKLDFSCKKYTPKTNFNFTLPLSNSNNLNKTLISSNLSNNSLLDKSKDNFNSNVYSKNNKNSSNGQNLTNVNNYLDMRHKQSQEKLRILKKIEENKILDNVKNKPCISSNSKEIVKNINNKYKSIFEKLNNTKIHSESKNKFLKEKKQNEELNNKKLNNNKDKDNCRNIQDLFKWKNNKDQKLIYNIENNHKNIKKLINTCHINETSKKLIQNRTNKNLESKEKVLNKSNTIDSSFKTEIEDSIKKLKNNKIKKLHSNSIDALKKGTEAIDFSNFYVKCKLNLNSKLKNNNFKDSPKNKSIRINIKPTNSKIVNTKINNAKDAYNYNELINIRNNLSSFYRLKMIDQKSKELKEFTTKPNNIHKSDNYTDEFTCSLRDKLENKINNKIKLNCDDKINKSASKYYNNNTNDINKLTTNSNIYSSIDCQINYNNTLKSFTDFIKRTYERSLPCKSYIDLVIEQQRIKEIDIENNYNKINDNSDNIKNVEYKNKLNLNTECAENINKTLKQRTFEYLYKSNNDKFDKNLSFPDSTRINKDFKLVDNYINNYIDLNIKEKEYNSLMNYSNNNIKKSYDFNKERCSNLIFDKQNFNTNDINNNCDKVKSSKMIFNNYNNSKDINEKHLINKYLYSQEKINSDNNNIKKNNTYIMEKVKSNEEEKAFLECKCSSDYYKDSRKYYEIKYNEMLNKNDTINRNLQLNEASSRLINN